MKIQKNWYKSKTMLALLPIALYYLAKSTGIEIPEGEVVNLLESGTTFVLLAIGMYGRFTANKRLK